MQFSVACPLLSSLSDILNTLIIFKFPCLVCLHCVLIQCQTVAYIHKYGFATTATAFQCLWSAWIKPSAASYKLNNVKLRMSMAEMSIISLSFQINYVLRSVFLKLAATLYHLEIHGKQLNVTSPTKPRTAVKIWA